MEYDFTLGGVLLDLGRMIAIIFAAYALYRWGVTAGKRETALHFADQIGLAAKMVEAAKTEQMRGFEAAFKLGVESVGNAQEPAPDWTYDPETGNFLDKEGVFHTVIRSDAEMLAAIRASLAITSEDDLLAQLRAKLDFGKLEIQTLQRGIEIMRGSMARAGELLPGMMVEVTMLRSKLKPFADAFTRGDLKLLGKDDHKTIMAYQEAALALAPKADPKTAETPPAAPGEAPAPIMAGAIKAPTCPKCRATGGGDWSQCFVVVADDDTANATSSVARCPIKSSPHFDQAVADHYAGRLVPPASNDLAPL